MGARRCLLALAGTVALVGCSGAASPSQRTTVVQAPPPHAALKLLQLNVRDGATDGRAAGVVAVIKASHADVVTLDEVTVKSIFQQIAAGVGFQSYYVPGVGGWSVGLLSRFPIRGCVPYNRPPMQRAAYGCAIRIARTTWWVFGAHLGSGTSDITRTAQAVLLLHQMQRHASWPVVLAGDLNSQTPGENDKTPLIIIPRIKSAGYTDSYREVHPSVQQDPGLTITTPPFGTLERRIDYVFHNDKAQATSASVISSVRGFTWPSDHAALAVTLTPR